MGDHDGLESVITIGWNAHAEMVLAFEGENDDLRAEIATLKSLIFGARSERSAIVCAEQIALDLERTAGAQPPANDDKPDAPRPSALLADPMHLTRAARAQRGRRLDHPLDPGVDAPAARRCCVRTFTLLIVLFLCGCASNPGSEGAYASVGQTLADLPPWMGGLPADAPPRPGTPAYEDWMARRSAEAKRIKTNDSKKADTNQDIH